MKRINRHNHLKTHRKHVNCTAHTEARTTHNIITQPQTTHTHTHTQQSTIMKHMQNTNSTQHNTTANKITQLSTQTQT